MGLFDKKKKVTPMQGMPEQSASTVPIIKQPTVVTKNAKELKDKAITSLDDLRSSSPQEQAETKKQQFPSEVEKVVMHVNNKKVIKDVEEDSDTSVSDMVNAVSSVDKFSKQKERTTHASKDDKMPDEPENSTTETKRGRGRPRKTPLPGSSESVKTQPSDGVVARPQAQQQQTEQTPSAPEAKPEIRQASPPPSKEASIQNALAQEAISIAQKLPPFPADDMWLIPTGDGLGILIPTDKTGRTALQAFFCSKTFFEKLKAAKI